MSRIRILSGVLAVAMASICAFASLAQAEFGFVPGAQSVTLSSTQAGGHPDLTVDFEMKRKENGFADGEARDIAVTLPPGIAGSATAVPRCSHEQLVFNDCPLSSQVGVLNISLLVGSYRYTQPVSIFNLDPPASVAAEFAGNFTLLNVYFKVTVDPDGYRLRTVVPSLPTAFPVTASDLTLWGVPADPSHDPERRQSWLEEGHSTTAPRTPLLTNGVDCSQSQNAEFAADSWEDIGNFATDTVPVPVATGCDRLPALQPSASVSPTAAAANQPSGYDFELEVPAIENPYGVEKPPVKRIAFQLPRGVAISPAAADGLAACADAQMGFGTEAEPACPDASKVGWVSIVSPDLDVPVTGSMYLGEPLPGNRYRLFLAAKARGVTIKQVGTAVVDPQSGQITTVFDETPPLPFSSLHVHLKGGERALLANPAACGTYKTTATLTPYGGGPAEEATSSFKVDEGCGSPGFSPGFAAGAESPLGGVTSPFTARITRDGAEPALGRIDVGAPAGLSAYLAGVPYCPEAALQVAAAKSGGEEQADSSCPAASQVGTVQVGAGLGPSPFYVPGKVYLAGPYKGAPLSLATVVPALAGPYDLGTVVVRSAVLVDPGDAHVAVKSDPLPQILGGIPLQLRDVRFNLDRPQFTLNPTGCDPASVNGLVSSIAGDSAGVSAPFQVVGCGELGFKPKLSMSFSGPTHRSAHPALRAVLKAREGDADIAKAVVTLPKTEFLENAHIRTICTRVQYAANECPKASIYGYAKAWSPLLDQPLQGPVYLRSSNHQLPDLVASLDGQIHIDLAGRIDSVHQRIRNTFEAVPDAPINKFVLTMQGGKKGLLVNNTELCGAKPRLSVQFTGHNGKHSHSNPLVKTDCGKK